MTSINVFLKEEDGGELVEYALVIGVLVVGISGIMPAIQTAVNTLFTAIQTETTAGAAG